MKRKAAILTLLALLFSGVLFGHTWELQGQEPGPNIRTNVDGQQELAGADGEDRKWTLAADRIFAQHDSEYIQAEGNVTLKKGGQTLRADFVRFYQATQWAVLKGHVRAVWEKDFLEAEEAEFDLRDMTGWLKKGRIFVAKPHIILESDYIRKYSADSYTFKNAKVTRCSGPRPSWSVSAREGDIDLDDTIKLWHTTFNVADVPVLYSPYLSLPGARKRQSGFLFPEVGSSDRLGFHINQPYYWAIDDEMDMTFYENAMSRRGLMQGVEFRHSQDTGFKGLWRFDYLNDRKRDGKESDEDDQFNDDGLVRPDRDRWWLRAKMNGHLGDPRWKTFLDLDLVSDQNYLREFKYGLTGFDKSRDEFVDEFGRGLDEADSLTRTSKATIMRDWDRFGFAAFAQYTRDLSYSKGNLDADKDDTVQKLPQVEFYAFKDRIPGLGGLPLEFQASSQYDYFHRTYGSTGHRLNVEPEFSLPLSAGPVSFIPRVGAVGTFWDVSRYENEDGDVKEKGTHQRLALEAGAVASSEFYRTYSLERSQLAASRENVGRSSWTAIKHSIVPRVEYGWRQNARNQDEVPEFDELDRLEARNEVTYSLTNTLDRRRDVVLLRPDGKQARPVLASSYLDFFRFRLEQSYDLREATRKEQLDRYEKRPFSDALAEVSVKPEDYLTLSSRTFYSPYESKVTEQEFLAELHKDEWGRAYFGFDLQEPIDEYTRQRDRRFRILKTGGEVRLSPVLTLGLDFRFDLVEQRDLEKTLRLTWDRECYTLTMFYSKDEDDNRFGMMVDLFKF